MPTRRTFLRCGLIATPVLPWARPLCALGASSGDSPGASSGLALRPPRGAPDRFACAAKSLQVDAVIYDGRYDDARAFACALVRRGAVALDARDDVVRLWRGPLRARFTAGAWRVAGLTTHSDFTLARASARDLGLVLLQKGAHDQREARRAHHSLHFRADGVNAAVACAGGGAHWARALGAAVASGSPTSPLLHETITTHLERTSVARAALLVSWVFVPRASSRGTG